MSGAVECIRPKESAVKVDQTKHKMARKKGAENRGSAKKVVGKKGALGT